MSRIESVKRSWSLGKGMLVLLIPVVMWGCSKKSTSPDPTLFDGHVLLAPGQVGDVNQTKVQVYYSDPFAVGATPALEVTATGSSSDAAFSFGTLAAGDFYVVAWKDNGNTTVGSGDLQGWYNGLRNGSNNPLASVIHLLHGEHRSVNISVSLL